MSKETKSKKQLAGAKGGASARGKRTQGTIENRVAWSGGLKDPQLQREGGQLLAWLLQVANDRGLTLKEMVQEIGISYGYFSQLRSGTRETRHLSDEVADKIATFLRVPRIAVLVAAGRVRPEDFYEHPEQLDQQLDAALQYIQKDPYWGMFVPPDVYDSSIGQKQMVVIAYEEATGKTLLPERVSIEEVLEKYGNADTQGQEAKEEASAG